MAESQPSGEDPVSERAPGAPAAPASVDAAPAAASADAALASGAAAPADFADFSAGTPAELPIPLDQVSIEELLKQANFDDPSQLPRGADPALAAAAEFKLPSFQQAVADAQASSIDLLRDVELNVKIELGRSRMMVEDVLRLAEGSVVELDKLAGDPVDVFVNDRLVARGEVLVLNDNFCVRVNEIVAGAKEEAL